MSVAELQRYTAVSKYARWLEDEKRRETWAESVDRSRNMMLARHPNLKTEITTAYDYVTDMKVLGSQRTLQFGGPPALKHNARTYNCSGSYCDRLRFFQEFFYILLCGSGAGFSVQNHHISKLPKFSKARLAKRKLPKKEYIIPDSIEGWSYCISVLLSAYMEKPVKGFEEYQDCQPVFNYDRIREAGSPLSFGIGLAPGPAPLGKAILRCTRVLNKALESGLDHMDSLTCYDVAMHLADAVISGGVRRSATIVIFDPDDEKMLWAKTGDWRQKEPQRARSNNSVRLLRNDTEWHNFREIFEATQQFGEPGFYWTDHIDCLPNPCVEIGFWARLALHEKNDAGVIKNLLMDYDGPIDKVGDEIHLSGWQFCNLSTINGSTVESETDFYQRCQQAAFIGTLQAGFTSFPELGRVTEMIVEKEALLGVSISGIMNNPKILLNPENQKKGADIVLKTNEKYAPIIGINMCARGTCIKPDGNSASLMGSFPGVHAGKFRKGFRIVQANKLEAPYKHFRQINPQACEPSSWTETDDVIRFCVENSPDALLEDQMTAVQFLNHVKSTYENWVRSGKVKHRCSRPWLSHNVSNTVRVRDDEWDKVAEHIYHNRDSYAGVSFISVSGDRDFAQAPFTSVYTNKEQIDMYGQEAVQEAEALLSECPFDSPWVASDYALGFLENPMLNQKNWLHQLEEFATMRFDGDMKRATYCLKDRHNLLLWENLKANYQPVDYKKMVEQENGVEMVKEIACAGGQCEV